MSEINSDEIRVFFSWQSDSPKETNTNAIRTALQEAKKNILKKHPEARLILDEATRDTSGSPNIADKIFEKIDATQIFVADITTVSPPDAKRPSANPNVLIELGYAIAQVGWDRIILLFNEGIGEFPKDLPFDIVQNRVGKYRIEPTDKSKGENGLQLLVTNAIKAIVEKAPKTPAQLRGISPNKVKHERDVESLRWLMSQIHIPTLQEHIEGLPRYIRDSIFWYWEGFKGVATNKLFHLYDPALEEVVCELFLAWQTTLNCLRYHSAPSGNLYVFSNPGDAPLDEDQERDWQVIEQAAGNMNQALQKLLDRIRSSYLEINIEETSKKAWVDCRAENERLSKMFD